MQTTIELLTEKNYCLEKFFRLNEAELMNFAAGNFDHLEEFYASREGLLEIIKRIDFLLDEDNQVPVDLKSVTNNFKKQVLETLQHKNNLCTKILTQDLEILSAIENAKSDIIRELSQVRVTRKAIGSYKSGPTAASLDEEA
jgi:hypothetical protein